MHSYDLIQKACSVILEALETFWEGSDNLDDYKDKQKRRFVDYSSTKNNKTHAPNGKYVVYWSRLFIVLLW